jgi:hypothetical protein
LDFIDTKAPATPTLDFLDAGFGHRDPLTPTFDLNNSGFGYGAPELQLLILLVQVLSTQYLNFIDNDFNP